MFGIPFVSCSHLAFTGAPDIELLYLKGSTQIIPLTAILGLHWATFYGEKADFSLLATTNSYNRLADLLNSMLKRPRKHSQDAQDHGVFKSDDGRDVDVLRVINDMLRLDLSDLLAFPEISRTSAFAYSNKKKVMTSPYVAIYRAFLCLTRAWNEHR